MGRLVGIIFCLLVWSIGAFAQSVSGTPSNNVISALGQSHIPFVIASYTTTATAGALTTITSQALQWANGAYMWYAANSICTAGSLPGGLSQTAGWYYTTFSSQTAGTVFQNQYTAPGVPIIPVSNTTWVGSCTSTNGAQTAVTTEQAGPEFTVPANAMGANGGLPMRLNFSTTNSAGAKTPRARFGVAGTGGTQILTTGVTTVAAAQPNWEIVNMGSAGAQVGVSSFGFGTSSGTVTPSATIDTTQNQTISFTLQLGANTDTMALVFADVDLRYAP